MQIDSTATLPQTIFKRVLKLMGNRFEISVVADVEDEIWANNCIETAIGEIARIEKLLTTYNENSQVSLINKQAGIAAVKVHKEVVGLIERARKISDITQGAFDISYGSTTGRTANARR